MNQLADAHLFTVGLVGYGWIGVTDRQGYGMLPGIQFFLDWLNAVSISISRPMTAVWISSSWRVSSLKIKRGFCGYRESGRTVWKGNCTQHALFRRTWYCVAGFCLHPLKDEHRSQCRLVDRPRPGLARFMLWHGDGQRLAKIRAGQFCLLAGIQDHRGAFSDQKIDDRHPAWSASGTDSRTRVLGYIDRTAHLARVDHHIGAVAGPGWLRWLVCPLLLQSRSGKS